MVGFLVTLAVALPVWQWPDWGSGLFLIGVGVTGGAGQLAMTRASVFGDRPSGWQVAGSFLVIAAGAMLAAVPEPVASRAD